GFNRVTTFRPAGRGRQRLQSEPTGTQKPSSTGGGFGRSSLRFARVVAQRKHHCHQWSGPFLARSIGVGARRNKHPVCTGRQRLFPTATAGVSASAKPVLYRGGQDDLLPSAAMRRHQRMGGGR